MGMLMLGVGDFGCVTNPGDTVKTMALGSCVAIIVKDPVSKMVGMAHIALPESKINTKKAADSPGYFADTGIPSLLNMMKRKGMRSLGRNLLIKLAGGAQIMDANNTFNIGKRNVLAIKKILWQYGMGARVEDVGGNTSRTVTAFVDKDSVQISAPGKPIWEI